MPAKDAPSPRTRRDRLLITGAAGRIGRLLLPALADRYELHATDREAAEHAGVPIHPLDITDAAALTDTIATADCVLHLAATHLGHQKDLGPEAYVRSTVEVNVAAVITLLAAAVEHRVKRVVLMSSLTIHLGEPWRDRIPADAPVRPNSLYACTKLFAEQLAELHHRKDGLSTISARLGQPYPTSPWFGLDAMSDPGNRGCAATEEDIVRGTLAALETQTRLAVFNLLSACDQPVFDMDAGRRIGFKPRDEMTAAGPVDRFPSKPRLIP
ncbi:NAD-dependent epimerase/dehydratase family protein [Phycisphaera mikurensis]|uniref:NAD-dependent epimerase/dehydratase family protein n=1 Tax=Phycisphaera mikurensis (strain NBRC 102666 / KCTC 22515 / FYK2301M01) TaxID=1142394 RepID=I0ICP2_PHYMF|nr:NAD(P)-dependent oxidoreductase [Phycisphaera mikurensis]MBB6442097.1 uronate dehydrogenase [Phycisphaera mikurensis]BAM03030.1 NAD-dependent epimerase/dehydratase family protein [Phycisphaera mikurensis NBRC 102666]